MKSRDFEISYKEIVCCQPLGIKLLGHTHSAFLRAVHTGLYVQGWILAWFNLRTSDSVDHCSG